MASRTIIPTAAPLGNNTQPKETALHQVSSINDEASRPTDQYIHGNDDRVEMNPNDLLVGDSTFIGSSLPDSDLESTDSKDEAALKDARFEFQQNEPQDPELPPNDTASNDGTQDLSDSAVGLSEVEGQALPTSYNTYNILILGETQSGKSTLIESLKKYANPEYTINIGKIGDGTFSLTNEVRIESITTNLPKCFISRLSDETREQVNHEAFIDEEQEDYEDELNDRKSYQVEWGPPELPTAYFKLIDTPGVNNTGSNDKSNLDHIFKRFGNISDLHLVIVTVSNNPFTQDLKDSIQSYFNLLNAFKGLLVFVHTKVDYAKLHKDDAQFAQLLKEKNTLLHDLLGQEADHIMIDNDLGSKKAVRNCLTQNILRGLLMRAKANKPVSLPPQYRPRPPPPTVYHHPFDQFLGPPSPRGAYGSYGDRGYMAMGGMGGLSSFNDFGSVYVRGGQSPQDDNIHILVENFLRLYGGVPSMVRRPVNNSHLHGPRRDSHPEREVPRSDDV
ncbi:MAG: hypothetical protein BYD32DRAFT_402124 [Podila humilis]|nr:MAG: hypothetical protein BYD32DRAFT_402124 [Podila humilis]